MVSFNAKTPLGASARLRWRCKDGDMNPKSCIVIGAGLSGLAAAICWQNTSGK